ncbi:MAG: PorP/SprF family type IX secretion system membrane protein [Bacteroidota bacterium]
MKRILQILPLLLFFSVLCRAQDFTFSQFYEQPLLRNPALAGLFTGDIRVSMSYRDQWGSVTVPFRTTSLNIEHKIPVGNAHDLITIASQMSVDAAGDIRLKRTQILPSISFHKSLSDENDTYLTAAFQSGPVSSQFDASQLKLGDQFRNGAYDASNPSAQVIKNTGYSYWDVNAGLSFSSSLKNKTNFYLAVGMSHITSPTIKSITGDVPGFLSPKMIMNAGINAPSGEKGHVMAFTDWMVQNGNRQLLSGIMYGVDLIEYDSGDPDIMYVGAFMRWGDALIPVVKMGFSHFSVGISYDVNISKLKTVSNFRGGLELSIVYRDFLKIRNSTLDKLRCTKF